ncbi:MAG: hypothetical protein KF833_10765 [Verrucomicrobiae bacterium]|nr:hypothetical protein [Verrucomicrobiae bacterium]
MFSHVDTRNPGAVLDVCESAWRIIGGNHPPPVLGRVFAWVQRAFAGHHPDFEPLDTRYHDFEHTLQGTVCLAQLLLGWHHAPGQPPLPDRALLLGFVAVLLHDTGYLKPRGDRVGTGAKFTPVHVRRSADLAARVLRAECLPEPDIAAAQLMILCTAFDARVAGLPFKNALDRRIGCALASADLLGQMAAPDYVDKLPALHAEFAEVSPDDPAPHPAVSFPTAADLIRNTPAFWTSYALPRLETEYEGVYRFLNDPWPSGPNPYLLGVEANLQRIRNLLPVTPAPAPARPPDRSRPPSGAIPRSHAKESR